MSRPLASSLRSSSHFIDGGVDRLLVISDIHSHFPPLEEFDRLRQAMPGRSQVIFNGDLFFGGPRVKETAQWAMKNIGQFATLGNHDQAMLESSSASAKPIYTDAGAYVALTDAQRDYCKQLPHRLILTWRHKIISLMHGHLTPEGEVGSWQATPQEQIDTFFDPDVDLCITSHTHYAFVRDGLKPMHANSGSMSVPIVAIDSILEGVKPQSGHKQMSSSEDARTSFLEITCDDDQLKVKVVRFSYDRQAAIDDLHQAGYTDMEMFSRWMADGILRIK